jgi:hypothetical protein
MMNWCNILTGSTSQLARKTECNEGTCSQGHEKQEMSEQIRGSKKQYFLLTQSNRITKGHL